MASKLEALERGETVVAEKGAQIPAKLYAKDGKIIIEIDQNQPWEMLREKASVFAYFRTEVPKSVMMNFVRKDGRVTAMPFKSATGGNLTFDETKHQIVKREPLGSAGMHEAPAKA